MADKEYDGETEAPQGFHFGTLDDVLSANYLKKMLAEAIATFALVFAGCGSVVVNAKNDGAITHSGISLVFGLIINAMVYSVGHISGAHINPAVTLAFATTKRFPPIEAPGYVLAQIAGATAAAGMLRGIIGSYGGLGTTTPSGSAGQSFGLEIVMTFFLMFVITSVSTDSRAVGTLAGIAIGGTVGLNILFAGLITGGSMNPARSLGPAFVSGIYTSIWAYIIGPIIGACLGIWTYELLRHDDDVRGGGSVRKGN